MATLANTQKPDAFVAVMSRRSSERQTVLQSAVHHSFGQRDEAAHGSTRGSEGGDMQRGYPLANNEQYLIQ